ncbi:MAG: hypothetical protein HP496_02035 [Nitrospira sp.]|nr:hypothetical protein [Nitrospira sp.]
MADEIGGGGPSGISLFTGQIGVVLEQIDHRLDGLSGGPIRLGPNRIKGRQETRIALFNEERRRRTPDPSILTGDVNEGLFDRSSWRNRR